MVTQQQPGSMARELPSQGDNFFTFHLLSANDLKTLQQHNAHFSDDILASVLNEPIKGNCFFWSAPDQPFVLPARILNFDRVGTLIPKAAETSVCIDVRARHFEGEARREESKLAMAVRETNNPTEKARGVEFYNLPNEHISGGRMIACYKPRLSTQVASKLDDYARDLFCSQDKRWVQDGYLESALKESGLVADIQRVSATRNGKKGDYYLIPCFSFDGNAPVTRDMLEL